MYEFKRMLVALDSSSYDQYVIVYAENFAHLVNCKKVYFIRTISNSEPVETIPLYYRHLNLSICNKAIENIGDNLLPIYHNIAYEIIVDEGEITDSIIKCTKKWDIDLIMLSKKINLKDMAESSKIAELGHVSMLFYQEPEYADINKLIIPFHKRWKPKRFINGINQYYNQVAAL